MPLLFKMPALMTGQTAVFTIDTQDNELIWDASLYQVKFIGILGAETLIGNDGYNMMTGLAGTDQHLLPSQPIQSEFATLTTHSIRVCNGHN